MTVEIKIKFRSNTALSIWEIFVDGEHKYNLREDYTEYDWVVYARYDCYTLWTSPYNPDDYHPSEITKETVEYIDRWWKVNNL